MNNETPDSRLKYERTISSDLYEVQMLLTEAMRYVDAVGPFNEEKRYDIKLIISELLTNALYHGNKNNLLKKIRLSISMNSKAQMLIQVEDEGSGIDRNLLRDRTRHDERRMGSYEENGRGLMLAGRIAGGIFTRNKGRRICAKINIME